ncbi:hypothetical protein J7W08_08600 [Methanococcoides orientis]|uniref:hypothetical protein n=1 Tax=Methanococcoides orientis TaxID=2822137 RepID=UPI001E64A827|nr:hypothetical protein [Methanococcoides orientis]UGV40153.1 hypothetical protein J7W08_08600 [Methanococcoides orientis]
MIDVFSIYSTLSLTLSSILPQVIFVILTISGPIYLKIWIDNKNFKHKINNQLKQDLSVDDLKKILSEVPEKKYPYGYAKAQQILGNKYRDIPNIDYKENNLKLTIQAYNDSLRIFRPTIYRYGILKSTKYKYDYATTQFNLGLAYFYLSKIRDQKKNIKMSIKAYTEAQKAFEIEKYQLDYTNTQSNLGIAYIKLSEIEDSSGNNEKAMDAFEECLDTFDQYLKEHNSNNHDYNGIEYAKAMVSYGRAIAKKEITKENLNKAIYCYEKALGIITLETSPIHYAFIQMHLGDAYVSYSDIEDKENKLKIGIETYNNSLDIFNIDNFPIQYAKIQLLLGNAYIYLSQIQNRESNLKIAINNYKQVLNIFQVANYPIQYAKVLNNLGYAFIHLSEVRDKEDNLKNATNAYRNVLSVFTKSRYPIQYATAQINEGLTYIHLSKIRNKKENLKKAL